MLKMRPWLRYVVPLCMVIGLLLFPAARSVSWLRLAPLVARAQDIDKGPISAVVEGIVDALAPGSQGQLAPQGSPATPAAMAQVVSNAGAVTVTLQSVGDACVLQSYSSRNFGATQDMWAGFDDNASSYARIARSLVQFNVSTIPAGSTVASATVRLYRVGSYDFPNRTRTITVWSVHSAWQEMSVTWATAPAPGEAYGSAMVGHGSGGWYEFTVTDLVQQWVSGATANMGIMVRGPEESGYDSAYRSFATRELTSYVPQLVVQYSSGPTPTSTTPVTSTPTATPTSTGVLNGTPTATATLSGTPGGSFSAYLPVILRQVSRGPTVTPTPTETATIAATPTATATSGPTSTPTATPLPGAYDWVRVTVDTTKDLIALHFPTTRSGWVVGKGGVVLHTADGGLTWQAQSSGVTTDLNDVWFIDETHGWIAGQSSVLLRTINGGETWTRAQATSESVHYGTVYFVDASYGWLAAGYTTFSGGLNVYGRVYRTTDGGDSWQQTTSFSRLFNDIYFETRTVGWLGGEGFTANVTAYPDLRKSDNGGSSWNAQTIPVSSGAIEAFSFVDEQTGWAVGWSGCLLHTTNGGAAWQKQEPGTTSSLYGVAFVDATTGWICSASSILRTTNSGSSWAAQTLAPGCSGLNSLYFIDATHGWAVGNAGVICRYQPQ